MPKVGTDALCLGCHRTLDGRPKAQPQVVPADHKKSGDAKKDACVACHKPHWPKVTDTAKEKQ